MEYKSFCRYNDILLEKFCFILGEQDEKFAEYIWSIPLVDTGRKEGEVQYKLECVNSEISCYIKSYLLNQKKIDDDLKEFINDFSFDINKMTYKEWVPMHNESEQLSPFELIIWLTKGVSFEGREFLMERADNSTKYKPVNFGICFLDTLSEDVFHGVSPLETDIEVISITGGLGRKK